LGVPSLTIPCGFNLGLPIGLQMISKYGYDNDVIDIGSEYQKVSDWHKKIPEKFL
jgi:aspartyl-tRNA(Asn)/glutamyl-tRNA(Gln) amidotransferase subunit A